MVLDPVRHFVFNIQRSCRQTGSVRQIAKFSYSSDTCRPPIPSIPLCDQEVILHVANNGLPIPAFLIPLIHHHPDLFNNLPRVLDVPQT